MKKILIIVIIYIVLITTSSCAISPTSYKGVYEQAGSISLHFDSFEELSLYPFESKYEFSYNYYLNKKYLEKHDIDFDYRSINYPEITYNPFEYLSYPILMANEDDNFELFDKMNKNNLFRGPNNSRGITIGTWKMANDYIVPFIYDKSNEIKNKDLLNRYINAKAYLAERMEIIGHIKINYELIPFLLIIPQYSYIKDIEIMDDERLIVETEINKLHLYEEYKIKIFLPREEGKYLINQISFLIQVGVVNDDYIPFDAVKNYVPYFEEYAEHFMEDKEVINIKNSEIFNCDFHIGRI